MKLLPLLVVTALLFSHPLANASGSMRCGTRLVQEGYSFDKVFRLCGKADATYSMPDRIIYRTVYNGSQEATIAEVVQVDMWVYRGSDNEFVRNLYFENGSLTKIEFDGFK